jgi:hypothetical protein
MAYRAEFQTMKSGRIPASNAPFQSAGNMKGAGILDFLTKHEDKLNKTARVARPLMTIVPAVASIGKFLMGSGEKMSGKRIKEFYNKHKNKLKTAGITLGVLASLAKAGHSIYNKFKGNDDFDSSKLAGEPLIGSDIYDNSVEKDFDDNMENREKIYVIPDLVRILKAFKIPYEPSYDKFNPEVHPDLYPGGYYYEGSGKQIKIKEK